MDFFNEISQQQKIFLSPFFLLLWSGSGLLLAVKDGGDLSREGQCLEGVTYLWWNWPLQRQTSAIVFPWFTFLGLLFRSKAKANGLFTDTLSSELSVTWKWPASLKIRPQMKREKAHEFHKSVFTLKFKSQTLLSRNLRWSLGQLSKIMSQKTAELVEISWPQL